MNKHELHWQIKQGMITPMKWEYQGEMIGLDFAYIPVFNEEPTAIKKGAEWSFVGTVDELSGLLTTMSK
jgi:hypothetical protein